MKISEQRPGLPHPSFNLGTKGRLLALTVMGLFSSLAILVQTPQAQAQQAINGPLTFFFAPDVNAHLPLVQRIQATTKTINMTMFRMTDPAVINALGQAASRGVVVRVIFDKIEYATPKVLGIVNQLTTAGVLVRKATPAFNITHAKAATFDGSWAMISTMNQVDQFMDMLDYGILISDQNVIQEMDSVFETDWLNSAQGTSNTPALNDLNLVWSPVNSTDRLVALIDSAQVSLILTVENLNNTNIISALTRAAARHVNVRTLVPECDIGTPSFNQPASLTLQASGVSARMLPGPATTDMPYVHAKTIVVDQNRVYLGSENFTPNSLEMSRELGIILPHEGLAKNLGGFFEKYWVQSVVPPTQVHYNCPTFPAPIQTAPSANALVEPFAPRPSFHGETPLVHGSNSDR